jgi:hypothetical protein
MKGRSDMKNGWEKGRSIWTLWAALSLVAFCGQTSEPGLMKVAEPLYVVQGLSSNSGFLVTDEGILVVDSGNGAGGTTEQG